MELVKPASSRFDIETVRAQLGDDWPAVNREIMSNLTSDVALVNSVAHYIINSGGKRLRPLLVLLAAKACGYQGDKHALAAVIVEFIHTATLLHDDVVDDSSLRRGQDTANTVFGNQASVLVGDFLYSRAFQLMVRVGQMRVMDVLADATNTMWRYRALTPVSPEAEVPPLTVVEPGGLAIYRTLIDHLMTTAELGPPSAWMRPVFEDVLEQELDFDGDAVQVYDVDSLAPMSLHDTFE